MEGLSGEEEGRNSEEKIEGIRSIIGRHKIDRKCQKWYRKQKIQRTYMYNPWT